MGQVLPSEECNNPSISISVGGGSSSGGGGGSSGGSSSGGGGGGSSNSTLHTILKPVTRLTSYRPNPDTKRSTAAILQFYIL